jgi:hypothetical protein
MRLDHGLLRRSLMLAAPRISYRARTDTLFVTESRQTIYQVKSFDQFHVNISELNCLRFFLRLCSCSAFRTIKANAAANSQMIYSSASLAG